MKNAMNLFRLLICLCLLPQVSRAQVAAVFRVLDADCIAVQARQCLDRVLPPEVKIVDWQKPCQPGYTSNLMQVIKHEANEQKCVRNQLTTPADVQIMAPIIQACELDARVNYPAACVHEIRVDDLLAKQRVEYRKILSRFCETYADAPVDRAKCAELLGPPPAAQ